MAILQCYGYSLARKTLSFAGEYYRKENNNIDNGKIHDTMCILSSIMNGVKK